MVNDSEELNEIPLRGMIQELIPNTPPIKVVVIKSIGVKRFWNTSENPVNNIRVPNIPPIAAEKK